MGVGDGEGDGDGEGEGLGLACVSAVCEETALGARTKDPQKAVSSRQKNSKGFTATCRKEDFERFGKRESIRWYSYIVWAFENRDQSIL